MKRPAFLHFLIMTALCSACATPRYKNPEAARFRCSFTVTNRTDYALEIRKGVHYASAVAIGTLNPGELLSDEAQCSDREVWIIGTVIPWQVGACTRFRVVDGSADLREGERSSITLHNPLVHNPCR